MQTIPAAVENHICEMINLWVLSWASSPSTLFIHHLLHDRRDKNQDIAEMVVSTSKDRIHIEAQHIPGDTNKRADWLSRNADPKTSLC